MHRMNRYVDDKVGINLTNRFELSDSVVVATFDIVNVKLGHNTVSVSHYSLDGIPDAHATATAVRKAVAGLEEQG